MKKLAFLLVKYRNIMFGIMGLLTLVSLLMVSKININSDMTQYLPSDSPMREGIERMKESFPAIDINEYVVNVMMKDVDKNAMALQLQNHPGLESLRATRENPPYVMFQFTVPKGSDPKATVKDLENIYGDNIVAETNADSIMPDNMVLILLIGVVLIFGILFFMCSSYVEALLFIFAIGMAVMINMGTNALLPSVSMLTNTISAVLQLVLSMDYSIILMNRFRQELQKDSDEVSAMSNALYNAAPSILSSGLTTIVGLLALVFMKFRIGMDLGVVLAKGVFCCLVAIFTILPALIIIFKKAVKATQKKVYLVPTDRLAAFEMRFRIPLAILFVTLFLGSYFLHDRTELSYASIWESEIAEVFPPQNTVMLLYDTKEEDKLIELTEKISADPHVSMTLSYPSIMLKKHTPAEMAGYISGMLTQLPDSVATSIDPSLISEQTLSLLYYACTHPERDEKLSFDDIQALADGASKSGMIPAGFDMNGIAEKYIDMFTPEPQDEPKAEPQPQPQLQPQPQTAIQANDSLPAVPADTTVVDSLNQPAQDSLVIAIALDSLAQVVAPVSRFNGENCTSQLTSKEMAEFLGFEKGQASTIYKIAGKRKSADTMTAVEFLSFVRSKILKHPVYSKFISKQQASDLELTWHQVDSAVLAYEMSEKPLLANAGTIADTLAVAVDSLSFAAKDSAKVEIASAASVALVTTSVSEASGKVVPAGASEIISAKNSALAGHKHEKEVETPLDRLAEMAFSGEKYSVKQIQTALSDASIDIDPGLVKLLCLYYGSTQHGEDKMSLSLDELVAFLTGPFLQDDSFAMFINDEARTSLGGLKQQMTEGLGQLRSDKYSMAVFIADYSQASEATYDYVDRLRAEVDGTLQPEHFLIGESVMYKEMKDGFSKEMAMLTLLTVISIFLIVAISFKSLIIPTILVMTVLTGVYVNVFFSGIGGRTMLYLAYLIVQSILMGATIDYGILFTNYYLEKRQTLDIADSLHEAYRGSRHTIMTSGLIIIFAPYIMSVLFTDPTISSILSNLTVGALAAITVIFFILPGTLAVCDKLIVRKK